MNQWMFYFDGFGIKHLEPVLEGNPGGNAIKDESPGLHPPMKKQIFQPYLAKFMCNDGAAGGEGGLSNRESRPVTSNSGSRFVFYNVDDGQQQELARESNFGEIVSREKSDFISKDDLDSTIMANKADDRIPPTEREQVHAYATQLQMMFDNRNVKLMELNLEGANDAIERDFDTRK